ncbi:MAG: DUF2279 domain-containing protein [Flavobacteriaceae bacterium]|jgi:uncharacterized protein YfiM (DUF2279 family)
MLKEQLDNLKIKYLFLLLLITIQNSFGQDSFEQFLKPSDSLNQKRLKTVWISQAAIGGATLLALNQAWYADYPRSKFHFINDNQEWLQVDKIGHFFSSYHLGKLTSETYQWSGLDKKKSVFYGVATSLVFMTTVEVFDGFSKKWGASLGDIAANFSGSALYVSQELIWNEQRIIPKFSFHTTSYASRRPNVLGSSLSEQILKDYNGQTYWLSFNINSFIKKDNFPDWLNLAVGYGGEGMITGNDAFVNTIFLPSDKRYRQFYFSFDVDLTKIKTKSRFFKTFLTVFNTIKIPSPTLEIKGIGGSKFHWIYF